MNGESEIYFCCEALGYLIVLLVLLVLGMVSGYESMLRLVGTLRRIIWLC